MSEHTIASPALNPQAASEALTLPGHNPEAREIWQTERAAHLQSNSVLIPALAAENGIVFKKKLRDTLLGEGQQDDYDTTGLGRASSEVGKVINGTAKIETLFDLGTLAKRDRQEKTGDAAYIVEDYVVPDVSGLDEATYGGEAGKLFFGLLKDVIEPYKPQPGDGYITLTARDPERTYKVATYNNAVTDAKLCSDAEDHFTNGLRGSAASSGLRPLEVGGETFALRKVDGEHTALLTKPAVLNGVRLPVGSVMLVETDDKGEHSFAFGRLSAFSFSQLEDAKREFSSVFGKHPRLTKGTRSPYEIALRRFNDLTERSEGYAAEALDTYMKEIRSWDVSQSATNLLREADISIREDRVARMIRKNDQEAQKVAEIAWNDKVVRDAAGRDSEQDKDPKERIPVRNQLIIKRLQLARTFGQQAVDKARKLIDLHNELEAFV